ncbi:MAG: hypothetical protein PF694_02005 [Bacteroidetes bacterium]|jgi:hypothetical protein|nr:hypothetical protein [Bacteroidota bacterium]
MSLHNDQENQIKIIKQLLQQLVQQTTFLEQQKLPLRRLDLDVMMKRTHELYEKLCAISIDVEEKPMPEATPEAVTEAAATAYQAFADDENETVSSAVEPKVSHHREDESAPEQPAANTFEEDVPVAPPLQDKPAEQPSNARQAPLSNEPQYRPEPEKKPEAPKSENIKATTLDLFGSEIIPSLADQLTANEDKSVAAMMERQPITDIRTAIGINDKFLFINELFSGSLEAYNKMLDELNDFKSFNGASTFLIELKVQHQWEGSAAAWKKLVGLIERKFNVKPEDHAL